MAKLSQPVGLWLRWAPHLLAIACAFAGCSRGSGMPAEQVASAEAAYTTGVAAYDNQNYEQAREQLALALETGGLNVDLMVDAYLKLAVSEAETGNFEAAFAALEKVSQGAPNMEDVYLVEARVHYLNGDERQAALAKRKAKEQSR